MSTSIPTVPYTADVGMPAYPQQPLSAGDITPALDSTGLELEMPLVEDGSDVYCKIILSNILAGSLIGKSGSTISQIRTKSGASIRISNVHNTYSPERLALVSGTKEQVSIALEQIAELGSRYESNIQGFEGSFLMKAVIPKSAVSLLIGKGGTRINEMRSATGAKIHVSTKEEPPVPPNERVVKITGTDRDQISPALIQVHCAIQHDSAVKDLHAFGPDPSTMLPSHSSPIHGAFGGGITNFPPSSVPSPLGMPQMSPYPTNQQLVQANSFHLTGVDYGRQMEPWMVERNCEIFMQVPDAYVGILVGKNGQHISDIKHASGAKIEISKKGDYVEGTNDRLVTINGSIVAVHSAHVRLMRRILELSAQESQNSRQFRQEDVPVDQPYPFPPHYV